MAEFQALRGGTSVSKWLGLLECLDSLSIASPLEREKEASHDGQQNETSHPVNSQESEHEALLRRHPVYSCPSCPSANLALSVHDDAARRGGGVG